MITDELFKRVQDNLHQPGKGPYCIDLIVGKSCNLKCRYCWAGARPDGDARLSDDVLERFLDAARDLQVREISLTSAVGEPTLIPNIGFLMTKIKQCGFLGSLLTNGSLLNERFAIFLKEIEWDVLILSLDSFNIDIQYNLRPSPGNKDYFSGILEFLRYCRDNNPRLCLNLNMVVTTLNYREVGEYFKRAQDYGVRNITLLRLIDMNENFSRFALTQNQLDEFVDILRNLRSPVGFNRLEWLGGSDEPTQSGAPVPHDAAQHCYYHLFKMLIDSDGQVLACNSDASDKTAFNIKDMPLQDIYRELVKQYLPRRSNAQCYSTCCSPIKTMNQEIDFRLSHPDRESK